MHCKRSFKYVMWKYKTNWRNSRKTRSIKCRKSAAELIVFFSCVAKKSAEKKRKKKIETKTKQRRNKKWKKTHEKLKDGTKKLKEEAKWWLYKCKKEAKMNDNNEMKWKIAILNFVAYLKILRFEIFNAVYRQICLLF